MILTRFSRQPLPSSLLRTICETPVCPPELRRDEWYLGDFELQKKLGAGFASVVYQALDRRSGKVVALKVYQKANLSPLNMR